MEDSKGAEVAHDVVPAVGQVWRDNDPRGGPVFRIVEVDGDPPVRQRVCPRHRPQREAAEAHVRRA